MLIFRRNYESDIKFNGKEVQTKQQCSSGYGPDVKIKNLHN